MDFTLSGHDYTYEAAQLDGNFSRADGEAVGSVSLNAEYDATLDRLSPDVWRAHWSKDGVSYYMTNFDGAEESAITGVCRYADGKQLNHLNFGEFSLSEIFLFFVRHFAPLPRIDVWTGKRAAFRRRHAAVHKINFELQRSKSI